MREAGPPRRLGSAVPLLPAAALFAGGILLARAIHFPPWLILAGGAALLTAAAGAAIGRRLTRTAALAMGCVFLLCGAIVALRDQNKFRRAAADLAPWIDAAVDDSVRMEGVTLELPRRNPSGEAMEAPVRLDRIWRHGHAVPVDIPLLLRLYAPPEWPGTWRTGDRIRCLAKLTRPRGYRNQGSRPAYEYYWVRNIQALGSCKSPALFTVIEPAAETVRDRVVLQLGRLIEASSNDQIRNEVLGALLLGWNISTPELRSAYVDSGIYHLLVISGTHFTLVALFVGGCLAWLPLPRPVRLTLLLLMLVLYLALVQEHVAVVRAFMIATVYVTGRLLDRPASLLNATALSALLLLAWHPGYLFDAGFQLTFAAVLAIGLVGRPLTQQVTAPLDYAAGRLFSDRVDLDPAPLHVAGRRWRFRAEWWRFRFARRLPPATFARWAGPGMRATAWIGRGLLVSFAVLAVSLPLLAALHFPLPVTGTFLTVLATALVWPVMVLLLLAVPLSSVSPVVAEFFIRMAGGIADWLNALVTACRWPPLWAGPPSPWAAALYLLLLLGATALPGRRCRRVVFLSAFMLALLVWAPVPKPAGLQLSVLDVGEGDCLLLRSPDGDNVLVDTGGAPPAGPPERHRAGMGDLSRRVIIPTLLEKGVRRLDALILTHFDTDHAGSAGGLLRAFPVARVYVSDAEWRRRPALADELAAVAGSTGAPIEPLAVGDTLRYHSLTLRVLHPDRSGAPGRANANSLVLEGVWRDHRILLPGDIEADTERSLLAQGLLGRCGVLKSPHHGSQTSSSPAFLRVVNPSLVVISSGPPGRFAHPSPRVTERLDALGIPYLTTHGFGEIRIRFNQPGFSIDFPAQGMGD